MKKVFNLLSLQLDHGRRYAALDHVRAYAALLVLFAHILHNLSRGLFPKEVGSWITTNNIVYAFLAEGHAGVSLFLVLSAYLFTTLTYEKEISYWLFIRSRILRIYPLYCLLVFCGMYTNSSTLTFSSFLGALFLLQGTPAAHDGGLFTVILWTISTEFIFYFIFPFMMIFIRQFTWRIVLFWIALFILLRLMSVDMGASPRDMPYFTILGRMDQFCLGILAAIYVRTYPQHNSMQRKMLLPVILSIIGALIIFNRLGGWERITPWKIYWNTFEGILFAAFIVAYQAFENHFHRIYNAILSFIGNISYSIYLLHIPIIGYYSHKFFFQATDNYFHNAMINALVVIPIVLIISLLSFIAVERPFLLLRKPYTRDI